MAATVFRSVSLIAAGSHSQAAAACALTIAGADALGSFGEIWRVSMLWIKCLRLAPKRPRAAQLHR